jgi:hypothetical protein
VKEGVDPSGRTLWEDIAIPRMTEDACQPSNSDKRAGNAGPHPPYGRTEVSKGRSSMDSPEAVSGSSPKAEGAGEVEEKALAELANNGLDGPVWSSAPDCRTWLARTARHKHLENAKRRTWFDLCDSQRRGGRRYPG